MEMDRQIRSLNLIMEHLLEETNRLSLGSVVKQTFCNEDVLRAEKKVRPWSGVWRDRG